jgi:hypothetical protein
MESSTEVSQAEQQKLVEWQEPAWQKLQQSLPQEMDELAKESGALIRKRKVKGGMDLLRLVLTYAVCDWSLRLVGAWAKIQGIAELSDVALLYRFNQSGRWLGKLLIKVLQQRNEYLKQMGGVRLRLIDATVISKPGSQGTDWRVHVSLDLGKMCLDGVEISDARGGESLARFASRADEIWVGDRGYAFARGIGAILVTQARLVVRLGWTSLALKNEVGECLNLMGWLKTLTQTTERWVSLRTPQGDFRLRLIACPLPPAEAERARERVRKQAAKKGKTIHPNTLLAAGFVLLVSNLPAETWDAARILWLYRLRWQIELQFKRLKGLLQLDHLRAQDPRLVQTYLLGKLLAALLLDQLVIEAEEQNPTWFQSVERPVSPWRLQALLLLGIRNLIVGPLSLERIQSDLPALCRYLCDPPRARPQQLALARRFLRDGSPV